MDKVLTSSPVQIEKPRSVHGDSVCHKIHIERTAKTQIRLNARIVCLI